MDPTLGPDQHSANDWIEKCVYFLASADFAQLEKENRNVCSHIDKLKKYHGHDFAFGFD